MRLSALALVILKSRSINNCGQGENKTRDKETQEFKRFKHISTIDLDIFGIQIKLQ